MNTSTAAIQANVTVTTIRAWCRRGVVTAIKQAGRWLIDTSSLAARIAIGAMRARKKDSVPNTVDLTATYTWTPAGASEAVTITPAVSTRAKPAGTFTTVRNLAPLLANEINAIQDEGARLHTLTVLAGARIVFCDTPEDGDPIVNGVTFMDRGQVRVQYQGTRDLPVQTVVDLALKLRAQLAA